MVLVNFSHPMENSQIARIEGMIEYKIDKVVRPLRERIGEYGKK